MFQVLRPISQHLDIPHGDLEATIYALANLRYVQTESDSAEQVFTRIVAGANQETAEEPISNKSGILKALAGYSNDNTVAITFKPQNLPTCTKISRGAETVAATPSSRVSSEPANRPKICRHYRSDGVKMSGDDTHARLNDLH